MDKFLLNWAGRGLHSNWSDMITGLELRPQTNLNFQVHWSIALEGAPKCQFADLSMFIDRYIASIGLRVGKIAREQSHVWCR